MLLCPLLGIAAGRSNNGHVCIKRIRRNAGHASGDVHPLGFNSYKRLGLNHRYGFGDEEYDFLAGNRVLESVVLCKLLGIAAGVAVNDEVGAGFEGIAVDICNTIRNINSNKGAAIPKR